MQKERRRLGCPHVHCRTYSLFNNNWASAWIKNIVPLRLPGYEPDILGFRRLLSYHHLLANTLSRRVLIKPLWWPWWLQILLHFATFCYIRGQSARKKSGFLYLFFNVLAGVGGQTGQVPESAGVSFLLYWINWSRRFTDASAVSSHRVSRL